jgi:hypothetical protein
MLVQLQYHQCLCKSFPNDDLFGVMISLELPKSHFSPLDPGLDASKAVVASAKHGILDFSILNHNGLKSHVVGP